ncbi:MAG TPA: phospholipase [Polyangiaceae bacterium]|nr:phospholipase [Polyangiaceae bacterium]
MRQLELGGLTVRIGGGTDGEGGGDGPAVVLMHGFGAPGTDLVPFAEEIPTPAGTRWVFPEAPLLLPPELGGGVGRAWWMIDVMKVQMAMMQGQLRDLTKEEPEGMAEVNAKVNAMLDGLVAELGVPEGQLVLGGFSQGAMLACDVALRSERALAGLILMSGTFVAEDVWIPLMERRAGLPVLQSHGRQDPLLPFSIAERLRDALVGAGLEVTWVPFDGGHGVHPMVITAVGDFLGQMLS